ncbi:sensor histidine kinase [Ruminococcus flavefaciens]|uniref:Histidine kinase n=1 Tax=Ruminococcus flavefaciens TaxID=1265 RepID=A0A1K1NCH2_RUMFL|nr:histidine kinase [Ruminococcus flavefaciens]SFW33020.1 Histidine kinase [Ruminococcus flavefaciens]
MNIIIEFIGQSYMTLMLLLGLIIIMLVNRRIKIDGVQYVWAIASLVFIITVCEYVEYWCDTYNKPIWIRYVKSAITYSLNPLLILLELYLIAPIKHKFLLVIPYIINVVLAVSDLFGTNFIYAYTEDHNFISGKLKVVPAIVVCFYILLLTFYSNYFIKNDERSKAIIVFFMSFTTIITVYLEYENIIVNHTTDIAAMEMLIYYFYLAAIHHSKVQQKLHASELALERQNNELLMAQIQPHFINNSLLAIQARCMDYPEIYDSIRNFSRYLRSNFDNIGNTHSITFEQELKNIKAYLALEKMNFGDRLTVEYDIDNEDFMLPALSVEPLVENAVRHGVAARENGGVVQIIQRDEESGIIIEVRDIGQGKLNLTEKQEKRRGIGVANVRARLAVNNKGVLELIPEDNGYCARIILKDIRYADEKGEKDV